MEARNLVVKIMKNGKETVNVSLPAHCARWFIDFIPQDILDKIQKKGISLDKIQQDFKETGVLHPRSIFELAEDERSIYVALV